MTFIHIMRSWVQGHINMQLFLSTKIWVIVAEIITHRHRAESRQFGWNWIRQNYPQTCIGGSRGGGREGRMRPPGRPNSFDFMQFSGKFGVFTPPLEGSRPPSGKSWIRHWHGLLSYHIISHTHTHIHIHTHLHKHAHTNTHTDRQTHTHTDTHLYTDKCTNTMYWWLVVGNYSSILKVVLYVLIVN